MPVALNRISDLRELAESAADIPEPGFLAARKNVDAKKAWNGRPRGFDALRAGGAYHGVGDDTLRRRASRRSCGGRGVASPERAQVMWRRRPSGLYRAASTILDFPKNIATASKIALCTAEIYRGEGMPPCALLCVRVCVCMCLATTSVLSSGHRSVRLLCAPRRELDGRVKSAGRVAAVDVVAFVLGVSADVGKDTLPVTA